MAPYGHVDFAERALGSRFATFVCQAEVDDPDEVPGWQQLDRSQGIVEIGECDLEIQIKGFEAAGDQMRRRLPVVDTLLRLHLSKQVESGVDLTTRVHMIADVNVVARVLIGEVGGLGHVERSYGDGVALAPENASVDDL